ncbi:MAG: ATP-binding cassette domain-containing protein [Streptococcaceae bacterium]|jgi:ABC-2 type transport system ATP-binding protein|nr:ATP-binding cassette domain-containing protein [Streptococcaceae bacterium]
MEKVLEIKHLSKNFKRQSALKDISLTIQQGEIYGLIGRNGAGKTTLLKTITRLIAPTNGQIALFGSTTQSEWTRALSRTGAVIETPAAYDNLSAQQNLMYYCKLHGIVNSEAVIKETLEFVDLTNTGRKKFKQFSLGMKQKLGIAIALLTRPDFLILDEPINGLDPIAIADFRNFILKLNKERNMTLIISSHILSELYQVATRFGFIHEGALVKELSKEDFDSLSEEYIVVKSSQIALVSQLLKEKLAFPFKVVSEEQINIFGQAHQISEINASLVVANIPIDEIHYQKQDLENYFIELVSPEKGETHD